MSILDKASLIQIPSGYKSGKLYSIKPDNGDGDFDFSRSSSATRVNSEGLIETAQIIGSELMPSVGVIVNLSGSTITQISGNSYSSTSDGTSGSTVRPKFDFNTTSGKTYKLVITPIGTITGTINFDFYDGTTYLFQNYDFTTTKEIYFTDNGTVFGAFDGTQTYSISNFTISVKEVTENDIPRLDYSGGSCPSLLLERQSTNLVTYSEDYSDSSWTKVNASVSSNTATSPSGEINASTLVSTSGTSEQYLDVGSLSITSGEDYTMSVFVKKNDYDFFLIRFTGVGGAFSAGNVFFNINNGTLGTVDSGYTGSIESFANGWYRCSATKTASGTTGSGKIRLQLATSDNTESISGDGSSGTFIYGSQFEQNSYPTSYIPSNSGSSTTRTADVCNNAGTSATFNSTEGVLFVEMAALADDTQQQIGVYGDSTTEQLRIEITNNVIKGQLYNGAFQANMSSTQTVTNFNKVALKWKVDDFALWINGTEVATDSSGTTFSAETLDRVHFSAQNGSTYAAQAKTKQLMVFDEALSNEELSDLTGQINTSFVQLADFYNYTIL